ncbi:MULTISPECIES: glycosytransferase [unclassified Mesorhizobium]|uniref:glycosytransferase n=1 Tax=unclassified Mesorhizobium TaxID=325217 RepID=UPI002414EEB6|nr:MULTISPECIES: glycosytransferase [unclassified Mesorhizobium]MDG4854512.1 glycosytransferase [Mesorhizobium sp. WSM4982]MDG4916009.1 glycosytransferase [Mesorhizobium sp. WSM4983]
MSEKPRRALWLINHSTLRQFEVPLLESLGYEVFLPKIYHYDEANLSASVDFSRDKGLTIPPDDLETLNRHNFYLGMSPDVSEIANKHFDIAFCAFFPAQLAALVRTFNGHIVLRPFGLSGETTYTDLTIQNLEFYFLHEIEKRHERFWFGQAYDHLASIESGVFRRRALTLPLGLRDAVVENTWVGTDQKILFVCPRIGTSPYYNTIYEHFKSVFGKYPHIIAGSQPIQIENDVSVTGRLSDEDYKRVMRDTRVMFYHSREERHLHYHPLEAVRAGMPLIFMASGMLDRLGGIDLPGRCTSDKQAQSKIDRILKGDKKFIQSVISSQASLLNQLSSSYCEPIWRAQFAKIEQSAEFRSNPPLQSIKRSRRIAVILPLSFRGGSLNIAKMTAKMLTVGAERNNDKVEVVFAHPDDKVYSDLDFSDLKERNIKTRAYNWRLISRTELSRIQKLIGYNNRPKEQAYWLPVDDATDLLDCDFWILSTNSIAWPLAPLRPYCVFAQDFLQRYVPESMGDHYENGAIQTARHATAVFASTPHTLEDVVQYVGVPRARTALAPMVADFSKLHGRSPADREQAPYMIWTTNAAPHKNHIMTLEALQHYYTSLEGKLDCYVTGVNTYQLSPKFQDSGDGSAITKYPESVRSFLRASPTLRRHVKFLGDLPEDRYVSVLSGARFLLHNVIMDNGTFSVAEAAYVGTPSLSSDYPPMRYLAERFNLKPDFFDPRNPIELAQRMKVMEERWREKSHSLPEPQTLELNSWDARSAEFYRLVLPYLGVV